MKKNLILHIGMGKTGTSALQDFFGQIGGASKKSDYTTQNMAQ